MPRTEGGEQDAGPGKLRVGILGFGAVGSVVADAVRTGTVPGAGLALVHTTRRVPDDMSSTGDVDELAKTCDVVVEAATTEAVEEHGERILAAGADLLVLSTGALVDHELARRLRATGPGRLWLSSGAIGGLDLLRAAARDEGLEHIRLTTTKRAATLAQPWMDDDTRAALSSAKAPIDVFAGPADDAVRRFPRSLNVAATLALAVGSWDRVQVHLVGDPHVEATSHVVQAVGPAGSYLFESRGPASDGNPASSRIVPQAVLRALTDLAALTPATPSPTPSPFPDRSGSEMWRSNATSRSQNDVHSPSTPWRFL